MKTILSLFDYTGNFPKPWADNGYQVYTLDIENPPLEYQYQNRSHITKSILDFSPNDIPQFCEVIGIIAMPVCTDFALSGSRWFKSKDESGQTEISISWVKKTLEIIDYFKPKWWVLENPMSRIHKLVPSLGPPKFKFSPYEFAGWTDGSENMRKQTWLWGDFNIPTKNAVEPEPKGLNGVPAGWISKGWGMKPEDRRRFRSTTPKGFAKAFFEANKDQ